MDSQRPSSQEVTAATAEEEWQIVPTNWWRTPFSSISWSYDPEKASQNLVFAKPPHYHRSLYSDCTQEVSGARKSDDQVPGRPTEWRPSLNYRIAREDDMLNEELIGVKGASDVVRSYERAVGFDCSSLWPDTKPEGCKQESLHVHATQVDVELGRERWNELVENLVGSATLEGLLEERRAGENIQNSSGVRLLRSNIDCSSLPPTPKQFQLNPSASSFVPLGSPTSTRSSSSGSSFSDSSERVYPFPSSNPFPSLIGSKVDSQGCIVNIGARPRATSSASCSATTSDGISDTFLPPFLLEAPTSRRRPNRTSRTRAIVDQLRSQHTQVIVQSLPTSQDSSPTISEFGAGNLSFFKPRLTVSDDGGIGSRSSICSSTPPLAEDHDLGDRVAGGASNDNAEGWTFPSAPVAVDPETKRTRSRELLNALRRRTDSLSSNANPSSGLAPGSKLPGVSSTYTSTAVSEPEPLIESIDATASDEQWDAQEADEHGFIGTTNAHAGYNGTMNSHPFPSGSSLQPLTSHPNSLRSELSPCPSPSQAITYMHTNTQPLSRSQNYNYARTHLRSSSLSGTKYPLQGFVNNTPSSAPYTLLSIPLPMTALSMNMPIAPSIPTIPLIGNSVSGSMSVPLRVPVQAMQYSTLMHLRIMQQMQMMRNSMECLGLTVTGAGARVTQANPGMAG